jgi:hypothetical protein
LAAASNIAEKQAVVVEKTRAGIVAAFRRLAVTFI